MSADGKDPAELGARFEALLEEARLAGRLDELVPLWNAARARKDAASDATGSDAAADALPGRFGLIGDSPAMRTLFDWIERVAPSDVPVLIHGETGTGKELVARALHEESRRAGGPFVAENCAAVPANLLESELFGHKRGSFTGAVADREGRFVAANGGTLFLDEIGDMPLEMQAKLLRVLEEREVRPVGANRQVPIDVRVVAASHRDLEAMVAERAFREDLFYRLNVVRLELPPLREREGDVELLVRFFVQREAARLGVADPTVAPAALAVLAAAPWPGNVRQLENEIQRTLALSGGKIGVDDLSPALRA